MGVDLHTHSVVSDGSMTPADLVSAAAASGVSCVALTDHDHLGGLEEAARRAAEVGVDFIPGVELSVGWEGRPMHLLAYFIEDRPGPLQDELRELREGRTTRNARILERLEEMGIVITPEELAEQGQGGSVGRPHIAALLVSKGVVETMADAFDRFLANGRPAYVSRKRLDAHEAVDLTWSSGGVPVVAHPHTLADRDDEFEGLFGRLADLGVGGIECHYVEYDPDLRTRLAERASGLDLVPTGGSDFHGTYKPGIDLGRGRGDLRVPPEIVDALRERRPTGGPTGDR